MGAPLKSAHEAATPRVSWARMGPCNRTSSPADLMAETNQREIVSRDTVLWGGRVEMKRLGPQRMSLVLSRYHLSARTGHHNLSSSSEEKD